MDKIKVWRVKINSLTKNIFIKKSNMTTWEKIKDLLTLSKGSKTYKVVFYKEAILDDGRTIVTESEDWSAGVEVRVLAEDGTAVVLEAGNYALEDGTKLVIDENSALVSIGEEEVVEEEIEAQEEVSEDAEKEIADAAADETGEAVAEALVEPEVVDNVANAINDATGDEVTAVEEVKEELSEVETFSAVANLIEEKFESLEKRIEAMEDSPASTGLTHTPTALSKVKEQKEKLAEMNIKERINYYIKN